MQEFLIPEASRKENQILIDQIEGGVTRALYQFSEQICKKIRTLQGRDFQEDDLNEFALKIMQECLDSLEQSLSLAKTSSIVEKTNRKTVAIEGQPDKMYQLWSHACSRLKDFLTQLSTNQEAGVPFGNEEVIGEYVSMFQKEIEAVFIPTLLLITREIDNSTAPNFLYAMFSRNYRNIWQRFEQYRQDMARHKNYFVRSSEDLSKQVIGRTLGAIVPSKEAQT